jgi:phosphoglycolate phosphatase-like HAD superfamily hydrolase
MHPLYNHDLFIFDCDGVILDSNQLKIDAMKNTLSSIFPEDEKVEACLSYFKQNFGKSRFHHIDVFVNNIFKLSADRLQPITESILKSYSNQCKALYLKAEITPGFITFITKLSGNKYIASGSEQEELREVFRLRGLDTYFKDIYGSPTVKVDVVANILSQEYSSQNAMMFGDALSDLNAAVDNNIDFVAYLPFSNVKTQLTEEANKYDFPQINHWVEL